MCGFNRSILVKRETKPLVKRKYRFRLETTNHTAAIIWRIYYADCKRQRSQTAGRPARVSNTADGCQPPGLDPQRPLEAEPEPFYRKGERFFINNRHRSWTNAPPTDTWILIHRDPHPRPARRNTSKPVIGLIKARVSAHSSL